MAHWHKVEKTGLIVSGYVRSSVDDDAVIPTVIKALVVQWFDVERTSNSPEIH